MRMLETAKMNWDSRNRTTILVAFDNLVRLETRYTWMKKIVRNKMESPEATLLERIRMMFWFGEKLEESGGWYYIFCSRGKVG